MSGPSVTAIVIAYNMRRELPRTVQSLCAPYQRGLEASDIELIVLDNGSAHPADEAQLRALCPTIRMETVADGGVSPVRAINRGLAMARAPLVGVFIDGARMASPGLLAAALAASRLHERAVIGTIAFHLGPDVQARSMLAGYNQAAEDALLESIDWPADGYRLFGVSALASSSARGWLRLPSESNAMFMPPALWRELGGFDERFQAPGGGLVNLDTWRRATELPASELVMLLGEATFHQIHGGVATNAATSRWNEFHAEYRSIRGMDHRTPTRLPLLLGRPHPAMLPSLGKGLHDPAR